jgi:hypothetical protein
MNLNKLETEDIIDAMNEHKWIKYLVYGGATIVGVWILGKASKLLTDAIINFKSLNNAIKH